MTFYLAALLVCLLFIVEANKRSAIASPVEITYLTTAIEKGAVCLDGSLPAYHHSEGKGLGIDKWIIHLEGGIWCKTIEGCVEATKSSKGSSKFMSLTYNFSGMLSNDMNINPHFYNWNRIVIRSCDGSSYTGDVEPVDSRTNLHFRGKRIFDAMVEHLLTKGMTQAKYAILSGCLSGGMGSILHCDYFRDFFPEHSIVKCLSDEGYLYDGVGGEIEAVSHDDEGSRDSFQSRSNLIGMASFVGRVANKVGPAMFIIDAFNYFQQKPSSEGLKDIKSDAYMKCTNESMGDDGEGFMSSLLKVETPKLSMGMFITNTSTTMCQIEDDSLFTQVSIFNQSLQNAIDIWFNGGLVRDIDEPNLMAYDSINKN